MKKQKNPKNVKRGRRNRQRGAELQREAVKAFKTYSVPCFNRDRGGANHEKGDIEVDGWWLGCKRRSRIPSWLVPEKTEVGVIYRGDRMPPFVSLPLGPVTRLIGEAIEAGINVKEIMGGKLGNESDREE